jgi:hypothetical protein
VPRQRIGLRARSLLAGLVLSLTASFLALVPVSAQPRGGDTGDILPPDAAQSRLVQDPAWLAMKTAGRLHRAADGSLVASPAGAVSTAAYPSYFNLDATTSQKLVEPEGAGYDDLHRSFSDANYWNFCSAGAAAAAISYFRSANVTSWPAGTFTEPSYSPFKVSTYWKSQDSGSSTDTGNGYATVGRAYTMYLAEQVRPPSYASPGLVNFTFYPNHGGSITDQRDAINWEASGHSAYWQNYFYAWRSTSGLSTAAFKLAVQTTLFDGRAPLVLAVNTYLDASRRLPNWNRSVAHSITLIGYNDTTGTYRYLDTCGQRCGSTSNGGTHDVSQSVLFTLLTTLGYGFLY